ncbi:DUF302 domain-containing protein [Sulfurovum sp. zt1-1]|uniref:DUF302 domain-containing protein n=1 Tax=Sulfurovum zhangzhouensis TaxID=3019067 RepID=A0ABT7QYT2_9BACT|nr:DUF302 domain-containing protein [Sulfurovum zhangzhouensis]MDM5271674.1 DUF302 domain-containing protein [Sulfurovum zhangzhouensis]
MNKKLLGSVALSGLLLFGMNGCDSSNATLLDESQAIPSDIITPYTRVAVIPDATWDNVPSIAEKIAQYVVFTDEKTELGLPSNWVIAGANGGLDGLSGPETWETTDLLPIPVGTNKARVIEFCNKAYATQAIGTGRFHGSALPCEVSVYSDGTNVYVDMLDAEAIFNIFFADAKNNFTVEENEAFAQMASSVKNELRVMINAGLEDNNGKSGSASVAYTASYDELGPQFTQEKIDNDIALRTPYVVYKYKRVEGGAFTKGVDDKALAKSIIAALGTDISTADKNTGLEGLSYASAWRSGRPEPIAIPNVQVVEACSPKYAKKATALGSEYITALPCEFTVYVDETDETNQTMAISFLNPNFMFGTMFEGAVENAYIGGQLTKSDVIGYSSLADVVFADLRMIVDYAVQDRVSAEAQHNLNLVITE